MDADERARIRGAHHLFECPSCRERHKCFECLEPWPCSVASLLDALDAAEAKLAAVEAAAQALRARADEALPIAPLQALILSGAVDEIHAALAGGERVEP